MMAQTQRMFARAGPHANPMPEHTSQSHHKRCLWPRSDSPFPIISWPSTAIQLAHKLQITASTSGGALPCPAQRREDRTPRKSEKGKQKGQKEGVESAKLASGRLAKKPMDAQIAPPRLHLQRAGKHLEQLGRMMAAEVEEVAQAILRLLTTLFDVVTVVGNGDVPSIDGRAHGRGSCSVGTPAGHVNQKIKQEVVQAKIVRIVTVLVNVNVRVEVGVDSPVGVGPGLDVLGRCAGFGSAHLLVGWTFGRVVLSIGHALPLLLVLMTESSRAVMTLVACASCGHLLAERTFWEVEGLLVLLRPKRQELTISSSNMPSMVQLTWDWLPEAYWRHMWLTGTVEETAGRLGSSKEAS